MRVLGYIVAGWFLISILSGAVVALAVVFWLRRRYRRNERRDDAPAAIRRLDAAVERRITELEEDLPPDPLQSDEVVNAWALHGRDGEALERLRTTYEQIRERFVESRYELSHLRAIAETESLTSTIDRYERLDADVAHLRDYVGAVRLLADEA